MSIKEHTKIFLNYALGALALSMFVSILFTWACSPLPEQIEQEITPPTTKMPDQ